MVSGLNFNRVACLSNATAVLYTTIVCFLYYTYYTLLLVGCRRRRDCGAITLQQSSLIFIPAKYFVLCKIRRVRVAFLNLQQLKKKVVKRCLMGGWCLGHVRKSLELWELGLEARVLLGSGDLLLVDRRAGVDRARAFGLSSLDQLGLDGWLQVTVSQHLVHND